jgi:hypothetical protein
VGQRHRFHVPGGHARARKAETLDYFVAQYRAMLEDHLDDYAENFEQYMRVGEA